MDPLEKLIEAPVGSPYRGTARVSGDYGTQFDFGRFKVSFNISVACDQNEKKIAEAAEMIFCKVVELVEKDMGRLVEQAMKEDGQS